MIHQKASYQSICYDYIHQVAIFEDFRSKNSEEEKRMKTMELPDHLILWEERTKLCLQ